MAKNTNKPNWILKNVKHRKTQGPALQLIFKELINFIW